MELSKSDGEDYEKANLLLAKFYVDKVCLSSLLFISIFLIDQPLRCEILIIDIKFLLINNIGNNFIFF